MQSHPNACHNDNNSDNDNKTDIDDDILDYIPHYVASTPEIRYRKNFENFLSERYWETHPLKIIQNESNTINCPGNNENERRKRNMFSTAVKAMSGFDLAAEPASGI